MVNGREFIHLPLFDKQWELMGLTDDDLSGLQKVLTENPRKGAVITKTNGVRKIRIAFPGRGKSASGRVLYIDFLLFEKIYLLAVYAKNQKGTINESEKAEIRKLVNLLENELKESGEINDHRQRYHSKPE